LRDQEIVYECGKLIGIPSTWKSSVQISGQFLSLHNTLLKTEGDGLYNEFSAEILDHLGKPFAICKKNFHFFHPFWFVK